VGARDEIIEHLPRLRRYARALTGESARADDLVQDTLERALSKLFLWRAGTDLRAWLFTLMHNVFVNQVRTRRHPEVPLDDALGVAAVGDPMEAMTTHDVQAALVRLPEEYRTVILLVGLEQFGYAEAARILDIPVGTVMSRLSRAREKMRQLMSGDAAVPLKVVK